MQFRLKRVYGGWIIEYKIGFFGSWYQVKNHRSFSFEPNTTAVFSRKDKAAEQLALLAKKYC